MTWKKLLQQKTVVEKKNHQSRFSDADRSCVLLEGARLMRGWVSSQNH
jgi:hypothetical protein